MFTMAIDLCNKGEHLRVSGDEATWDANFGNALDKITVPLDSLPVDKREVIELAYHTALTHPNPLMHVVGDPAAWESNFAHALDRVAMRLDSRPSEILKQQALSHPDPMMREQALYEYSDRNHEDAIELLCQAVANDPDRQVRWDSLWAIEKMGGIKGIQALRRFQADADPEIAEWATLFLGELQSGDPTFDARDSRHTPGRTFDETIFLLIHCDLYIRLDKNNQQWGKLSLAPQGLARVYGQAHACPNVATRERQLVIAKTISDLHADGTPHMDNYLFRGFTERTREDRGNFYFESHVNRPFYVSGKADDDSRGVKDSFIGFMREGCWYLDNKFKVNGGDAIRYVRGRFQGWGYTNLEELAGKSLDEILKPGNGILSTLHDPIAGPLTNVFISGTFKGKLNDWDGDGHIDLNSRNVFSTAEGELDTDMDGIPDKPGMACCNWVDPLA
jgi:HEAT repeat protein